MLPMKYMMLTNISSSNRKRDQLDEDEIGMNRDGTSDSTLCSLGDVSVVEVSVSELETSTKHERHGFRTRIRQLAS